MKVSDENIKKNDELIRIEHLKEYFDIPTGTFRYKKLKAVDDVSFSIKEGETLGVVGESGCGKTTLGRTLMFLYKPTSGKIFYRGKEVKSKNDIRNFRLKSTMVFQDPYSSLNPRMTVEDIIGEPLDVHNLYTTPEERREKVLHYMALVGLPEEHATRYPHEFSGGQRQRIGIARALAVNPDFIICDEPVSALDVSIQAQVINMFEDLQKKLNLTLLFIAHDILIVRHISDRIAVMYLGKVVELGDSESICTSPLHPYTVTLMSAVPLPDPKKARHSHRIILQGDIPSPLNAPSGCPFRSRCPICDEKCVKAMPELKEVEPGRFVACYKYGQLKNTNQM